MLPAGVKLFPRTLRHSSANTDLTRPTTPRGRVRTAHPERTGEREFRFPGYNECHWPHGEPDNPDFDFCLAPVAPGKSYCEAHAEQAYRKKGS